MSSPYLKNIANSIKKDTSWHSLPVEIILKIMESSAEQGLSPEEVGRRSVEFGLNVLPEPKKDSAIKVFFSQFLSPLVYILAVSAMISVFFQHYVDAAVILSAVFLNTIIGFIQENKANKALEKLRNYIERKNFVLRGGQNMEVPSRDIVPGDIVFLQSGGNIPADCRIISSDNLEINEAALTGEPASRLKSSDPVQPGSALGDRDSMTYAGTTAVKGRGLGLVVATGHNTVFGKIAQIVEASGEEITPLQEKLKAFGGQLGALAILICFLIFVIGYFSGRYDAFQIFLTAVAVAVAAIPEGLPVAVTVILTIGMQTILKRKSLVKRLVAAETLGSVTAICTDKTGTLTEGKMRFDKLVFPGRTESAAARKILESRAFKICFHCNDAILEEESGGGFKISGSPTDEALLSAMIKEGLSVAHEKESYKRIKELSFDSTIKYMATLHEVAKGSEYFQSGYVLFAKGAPEIMLEFCASYYQSGKIAKIDAKKKSEIKDHIKKYSSQGLRLVALAYAEIKDPKEVDFEKNKGLQGLVFLGLAVLKDPLRPETAATIQLAAQAGIRTIVITGDHRLTAMTIAAEAGLKISDSEAMDGLELDQIDDAEFSRRANSIILYARVSPRHKMRIIKTLKQNGEVVAMIGDGVNDAPALKAADIGIALGSGTDVAKEAADIVLLDNNYSTIVAAVEQGRIIFSNIRKVITYLISDSFSEVVLIAGSILFNLPLALLPVQVLWVNILNDGFPNAALAFEPGRQGIMSRKPFKRGESVLDRGMKVIIFGAGMISALFAFTIFYFLLKMGYSEEYARTVIFASVGFDSLIYIFSLRSLSTPIWLVNPLSNKYLLLSVGVSASMMFASIFWQPLQSVLSTVPITDMNIWVLIFSNGFIGLAMIEVIKKWFTVQRV